MALANESARTDRVQDLIQARNFTQARTEAEQILNSQDSSEAEKKRASQLLGTIFYMQGNLSRAVEVFKKLLELDPKYTDAAISLSIIYNDIGKYDEAKKIYQIANQSLQTKRPGSDENIDKRFAIKHLELGDLYLKFHRYDEALEEYSKSLSLDQEALQTRVKIAKCYAKKGYTSRAVQELQQLCMQHPSFIEGKIQLGLMHFSLGNVLDAQVEWERARSEAPDNAEIESYLAMARQATETSI